MQSINCKGKLLSLEVPLVMGIINITHDSFYKGDINLGVEGIVRKAGEMLADGAAILDIGAQSTRPGSTRICAEDELENLLPVLKEILFNFPDAIISIDTYHSLVAKEAVHHGAAIINDISAGNLDAEMIPTVAQLRVPYVCMHMQRRPETMQKNPEYDDVVKNVLDFFIAKVGECQAAGIKDIIIDPGFGFGKTIPHNIALLQSLGVFQMLHKPILAGLSRKATIYKTLGISSEEALNGTTVLNTIALQKGASLLRVHDVKEAVETIKLLQLFKDSK